MSASRNSIRYLIAAAGLATLAVGVTIKNPPAAAAGVSGYDTFCKGGSPTPKYICDHLKAHDKKKPVRSTKALKAS
jgi:hypothetical protein